jgi:hypothetical protein
LIEVGKQPVEYGESNRPVVSRAAERDRAAVVGGDERRQLLVGVVKRVRRQADLLQVIDALNSRRRVTHFLHCRDQQRDKYRDDGNHNQQFGQ